MTDPGTVDVDTDALRAHATEVSGDLKSRVDLVVDAGHQVTPGGWDMAYGLLCQPFPVATNPITGTILAGLQLLADVYQRTAEELVATADSWDHTDSANSDELRGVGGMLGHGQGGQGGQGGVPQ